MPRVSTLIIPSIPIIIREIAKADKGTSARGRAMTGGPIVPHRKETSVAAPHQMPIATEIPRSGSARHEKQRARVKRAPPAKPAGVKVTTSRPTYGR